MIPILKEIGFQFLIGTLKTTGLGRVVIFDLKFQFLIGTLKTRYKNVYRSPVWPVSIPHRYAKNKIR